MDKNGWISFKDRLPDIKENGDNNQVSDIVLLTDGYDIFAGYIFFVDGKFKDYDSYPPDEYGIAGNPTHWQELPKMPGECEEITATCQDRIDIGAKP